MTEVDNKSEDSSKMINKNETELTNRKEIDMTNMRKEINMTSNLRQKLT